MERRKAPRHYRKLCHEKLVRFVENGLRAEWSPDVIVARLKMEYSKDDNMRIGIETIYRWVYRDASTGGQLYKCLTRCHKKRRKHHRYGTGRGLIPNRISINDRPDLVNTRQRFGDWEGDTVEGKKKSGHVTTHVERKSRYLIAAKLADKTAALTAKAITLAYRKIPRALRKTLTLDNGKEFAHFQDIERYTGLAIYFADPYSAWQRGTNENTNGLLRRYFPKGMDFRNVSEKSLADAVKKLNHRPRKCLNYRTPHEVFMEARHGAVAM